MAKKKNITAEEIAADLMNPFVDYLEKGGITDDFLVKQLKKEFENEEIKVIKVKGTLDCRRLTKNYKVLAKPKKWHDGDTIIEHRIHNIAISQKARMDVHKLKGHYPAEKHELSGTVTVLPQLSPEDRELLKPILEERLNAIFRSNDEDIAAECGGRT